MDTVKKSVQHFVGNVEQSYLLVKQLKSEDAKKLKRFATQIESSLMLSVVFLGHFGKFGFVKLFHEVLVGKLPYTRL